MSLSFEASPVSPPLWVPKTCKSKEQGELVFSFFSFCIYMVKHRCFSPPPSLRLSMHANRLLTVRCTYSNVVLRSSLDIQPKMIKDRTCVVSGGTESYIEQNISQELAFG